MNKFLLIVIAIFSINMVQAQDLSVSGGYVQGLEFLGDDIKEGASVKVAIDFDIFKKHKFHFGPSISVTGFTKLGTDSTRLGAEPAIDKTTLLAGGLTTGYGTGRFKFKSGLSANTDNSRPTEGYKFTERLVLNNALEYQLGEGGMYGIRLGHDYFFNQYLFHYTHQTTLGVVLKF